MKDSKKKKKKTTSIHSRNRCQHPPKTSHRAPDLNIGTGFTPTDTETPDVFRF